MAMNLLRSSRDLSPNEGLRGSDQAAREEWIQNLRLSSCSLGSLRGSGSEGRISAGGSSHRSSGKSIHRLSGGSGRGSGGQLSAEAFCDEIATLFEDFDFEIASSPTREATGLSSPMQEALDSDIQRTAANWGKAGEQRSFNTPMMGEVKVFSHKVTAAQDPTPSWPGALSCTAQRPGMNTSASTFRRDSSPDSSHRKMERCRSFTDIYAGDDEEWVGQRVLMKKGKYAGRGAYVKNRANKKYRVMVDGVTDQLEFYPTSFEHV